MLQENNIRPDVQSVLNASALLDITEYHLFRLAYLRWFGVAANERVLEPYFVAYMFGEVVPVWVRHFARLVERLHQLGTLDRVALGVERLPHTQQMVNRGIRIAAAMVTGFIVLVVLAELAAKVLRISERCFFPPCY